MPGGREMFEGELGREPPEKTLTWHWDGPRRVCDGCGGEVMIFEEGAVCSVCHRAAEPEQE